MATRIYLPSSGAAPVTPFTWVFTNVTAFPQTFAGVTSKIGSAFTNGTFATGTTNHYTRGCLRYVIGQLTAQEISGTVKMVLNCYEGNVGANAI